jgi:hypothetical protein
MKALVPFPPVLGVEVFMQDGQVMYIGAGCDNQVSFAAK